MGFTEGSSSELHSPFGCLVQVLMFLIFALIAAMSGTAIYLMIKIAQKL